MYQRSWISLISYSLARVKEILNIHLWCNFWGSSSLGISPWQSTLLGIVQKPLPSHLIYIWRPPTKTDHPVFWNNLTKVELLELLEFTQPKLVTTGPPPPPGSSCGHQLLFETSLALDSWNNSTPNWTLGPSARGPWTIFFKPAVIFPDSKEIKRRFTIQRQSGCFANPRQKIKNI